MLFLQTIVKCAYGLWGLSVIVKVAHRRGPDPPAPPVTATMTSCPPPNPGSASEYTHSSPVISWNKHWEIVRFQRRRNKVRKVNADSFRGGQQERNRTKWTLLPRDAEGSLESPGVVFTPLPQELSPNNNLCNILLSARSDGLTAPGI